MLETCLMCVELIEDDMYVHKGSAHIVGIYLELMKLSNMGTKAIVDPVHISILIK